MSLQRTHNILSYLIAIVWLTNGLFCKVLHFVPRHQQIVASILGEEHAAVITTTIGALEVLMTIWILSGIKSRINAITQIVIVAAMNAVEFLLVPDLLLFGRVNLIIAICFIGVIYYWEFVLNKKITYVPVS